MTKECHKPQLRVSSYHCKIHLHLIPSSLPPERAYIHSRSIRLTTRSHNNRYLVPGIKTPVLLQYCTSEEPQLQSSTRSSRLYIRVRENYRGMYLRWYDYSTCVATPTKKKKEADSVHKSTTGSTSTSVFLMYDVPYFRLNPSLTSNPKVHHPAIESLVLSLQRGKAAAVFVSSRHRDFVA